MPPSKTTTRSRMAWRKSRMAVKASATLPRAWQGCAGLSRSGLAEAGREQPDHVLDARGDRLRVEAYQVAGARREGLRVQRDPVARVDVERPGIGRPRPVGRPRHHVGRAGREMDASKRDADRGMVLARSGGS